MPRAHGSGVELEYETVGDPSGRPLLLVQGLGAQRTSVEDGLCQELASRGFLVVRYDNRDAGLSTWFDQARPVNLASIMSTTGDRAVGQPIAEAVRRGAARNFDRAHHPKGTGRQLAAILAAALVQNADRADRG